MSARDELAAAVAELGALPMPTGDTGPTPMADREQIRAELTAEFVAWLVKRAREHRAKGPQYAKQADVIGMLASKVSRGAVRPNNLLSLPPQGGPEDVPALRAKVDRLRARVAELEALKPARFQDCQACGTGYEYGKPCSFCEFKKRIAAEIAKAQAEDPHDSPLHHTYAEGRDLPEVAP
ncbi:hypothetical protein [Streptomyces sp. NPDC002908]|uniref:hypothetical protein n=1 Tax=Streptomyces sp. NPDC002908 TaxID=3364670 RepID=UPI00367B8F16